MYMYTLSCTLDCNNSVDDVSATKLTVSTASCAKITLKVTHKHMTTPQSCTLKLIVIPTLTFHWSPLQGASQHIHVTVYNTRYM